MSMIIDRFERDQAIIEHNGVTFAIPRTLVPSNAREGDVLRFIIEIDTSATIDRRRRVKALEDRLFKK
jgi:hypothetical protein